MRKWKKYSSGDKELNLFSYFFPDGNIEKNIILAFEQVAQPEKELLLWVTRKNTSHDTYLDYVISDPTVNVKNFRSAYMTKAACCLEKKHNFAKERKEAISKLADINIVCAELQGFIASCKNNLSNEVIPWLNCGTEIEKAEILRRCALEKCVFEEAKKNYPNLSAYMNMDVGYDDSMVTEYFKEYRKYKVIADLSQQFAERAFCTKIPSNIQSRNVILQQFSQDIDCSLLVVDAMGAEWLPMLITLAKEHGIGKEFSSLGTANLPSSTSFNTVLWDPERRLPDVKRFDNIAHKGAEAYEKRQPEENLASMLDVLSKEVLPRIRSGLGQFKKVLVTSDHGSSRLAVIANQEEYKISKTLSYGDSVEVIDWRYCVPQEKRECPPELEETLDGKFWIVRGYNRLSKKGGGQGFEVHGGATLEERLVPIVVFSNSEQFELPQVKNVAPAQIIENDDFDL